jgi:hypothetical protein
MDQPLTPDHFLPHLDKTFRVRGGRHAPYSRRGRAYEGKPGRQLPPTLQPDLPRPPGDVLGEGVYTLEAEGAAAFELYVMPIYTPARDRQDYRAAFN